MKNKPLKFVLADRLSEWMKDNEDLDTQVKVAAHSGVGQSSIQRILSGEVNPTLGVIEQLADAFGREVTDLLARPDDSMINYDKDAYRALPEYEKARIEAFIKHAIAQSVGDDLSAKKPTKSNPRQRS